MYLLGIDIGTTSAKCVAVDREGRVAARGSAGYPLETPRPGWAEQDPAWWVEAAFQSIRDLLATPGLSADQIDGISFSGQMHGLVPLDRRRQVIRKAILWCDQRTEWQCAEAEHAAGGRKALLNMTNNVMLTGYTGGKILWLREKEPENFAAMSVFLCPKDYLRFRMTGKVLMDVTEASGTGLFDTKNRRWCHDLIDRLDLAPDIFPFVVESTAPAGAVTAEAAEATGLKEGTPCFAGGGDAVVQSFGSGLIHEGTVGTVIGTAGNVSMGFDQFTLNPEGKLQMFCGVTPGSYMSFGATQTAGGALRWFRDQMGQDMVRQAEAEGKNAFDLMTDLARQSPAGANGVVFAPYLSGERCPWPDPHARGVLYGLSLSSTRADVVRAVMEGIVFSLRQIVNIYRSLTTVDSVVASGGGAESDLLLQMQADILTLPVRTVSAPGEGAAYGAALIAGMGLGWYASAEEAVSVLKQEKEVLPIPENTEKSMKSFTLYRMLYPALKDVFRVGGQEDE